MSPEDFSNELRKLANSLLENRPSRNKLIDRLQQIVKDTEKTRQAARLDKFTKQDYDAALGGLQGIIDKLNKVSKGLSPEDEAKQVIDEEVLSLSNTKLELEKSLNRSKKLNV